MTHFDRRRVLQLSGAAAWTLFAGRARGQDAAPPPTKRALKKSLMIGMIEGGTTIHEKLVLAKNAGFDGVEFDSPSEFSVDDTLAALRTTGLVASGVVDSVHWSKPLSDPDASVRDTGRTALEGAIRDARKLGTDSVLLVPAIVNAKVGYDEAWQRSTAEIEKVLPLAAEQRVHVSIENVWNNFLLSPLEAARYVDQFESPWVGWHLDLGNVVLYGWPEQWIRVLGARIRRLHIKDYSRKKLDAEGRWKGFDVELGQGDVDWHAVMQALDAIHYDGWGSAEVNGGDEARLLAVSKQMDELFAR